MATLAGQCTVQLQHNLACLCHRATRFDKKKQVINESTHRRNLPPSCSAALARAAGQCPHDSMIHFGTDSADPSSCLAARRMDPSTRSAPAPCRVATKQVASFENSSSSADASVRTTTPTRDRLRPSPSEGDVSAPKRARATHVGVASPLDHSRCAAWRDRTPVARSIGRGICRVRVAGSGCRCSFASCERTMPRACARRRRSCLGSRSPRRSRARRRTRGSAAG